MSAGLIVGFTGSREGMSPEQLSAFRDLFPNLNAVEFHHGVCVGSDEQAHRLVKTLSPLTRVIGHPPIRKDYLAKISDCDYYEEPKDYLVRNKIICDRSTVMIATPNSFSEQLRSGTWSTIRYALNKEMEVLVIFPDGSRELRRK
ncbi:MAG: hypothetical protein EOP06_04325 [Proteobacteria bacterium]|nr:MAG: hypothetical protein EOP06_04325 [Pseudomonadota bacterium]